MAIKQQQSSIRDIIVLDDQFYYLVIQQGSKCPENSPCFLHYRMNRHPACKVYGFDPCVGQIYVQPDSSWIARVSVLYDEAEDTDSMFIGQYDSQIDAIVALWQRRREAFVPPVM